MLFRTASDHTIMRIIKRDKPDAVKVEEPSKKASKINKPAPVVFSLPTRKLTPISDLAKLTILLYGEKKIGKSSLAAQFPGAIFLAFEKGYSGLSIFVEPMFNGKGEFDWGKFKKYVDLLVGSDHEFETVVIDTADASYAACTDWVCEMEGMSHPSDQGYGKGWNAVKKEYTSVMDKLINCEKFGVVFISHAVEKEFLERTGGRYDKIIASMPDQGKRAISAVCDCIVFYGYHGEARLLTIRGSDTIESGTRMKYNFWVKGGYDRHEELSRLKRELVEAGKGSSSEMKELNDEMGTLRVHSIPAGNDEAEAYFNFTRAFNNQQTTNGQPEFEFAYIEKKAPMTKAKK